MTVIEFYLTTPKADHRPVFLSGTFNHWCEADPAYEMRRIGEGRHYFRLETDHRHPMFYSYHKGDWNQEELDEWGNIPEKRKLDVPIRVAYAAPIVPQKGIKHRFSAIDIRADIPIILISGY